MKHQPHSNRKTGLLLSAGALFAFAFILGAPAFSGAQEFTDTRGMANRLVQLEKQVQTLSQSVFRGAPPPADAMAAGSSSGGMNPAALSLFEDRLRAVEEQQRNMISQVEKLGFDVRQMQDQMQKAQADLDMRFQQMSAAGASGAAASSATSSSSSSSLPADELAASPADGSVKSSGNSTGGTLGTLGAGTTASSGTAESLYESGFADIREQNFDAAQKKFTDFMARYPTHALAGNAQYWLAETYYVRGDYRQAAKLFAKGYQEFPQGQKAADCLLKLGLSLGKLGKKEDACLSLQQLQKEFPGDSSPVNRRAKQEMTQLGCG